MKEAANRQIDYLRISITDRCNLRCQYCMPCNGVPLISHEEMFRYEEILRVVTVAAGLGIRKVKITGGEPLLRRGVIEFIRKLRQVEGIEQVTMTTNGILLPQYLPQLADAGVEAVNVSLDTLRADTFRALTRCDGLQDVLRGIDMALSAGLRVKVNVVPVAAFNRDELPALARLAQNRPIDVRFIELMPIGCGKAFTAIPTDEVRRQLAHTFGALTPWEDRRGNGPARYASVDGFVGKIGFISPISHSFCQECNRMRLTSAGYLKLCLASDWGVDLRGLLRGGIEDGELTRILREAIMRKPLARDFAEMNASRPEQKSMFQIGG